MKELDRLKGNTTTDGFGYEEYKTPRVCFSNSIEGALNSIINEHGRMNLAGKQIHVYTPEKPIAEYKHKTNKQILKDGDIFDANITNEMWILEPVKLVYVGSIVVDKVSNEHVKKFANNEHKTQIKYSYKWHWFRKIKYRFDEKKGKFVHESASMSECRRAAEDIRNKTAAYLRKVVSSEDYKNKWFKYHFCKDNINISETEYGDYCSLQVCDESPFGVDAEDMLGPNETMTMFTKWYNSLINIGINFVKSKFAPSLDKYDIDVNDGDGDECTIYFDSTLKKKNPLLFKAKRIFKEESILTEVKKFPVEFDQDGNLIIYKTRFGNISYGDEINDSVKLLEAYRNAGNIEGVKYELAKLWFINDSIEKQLKKRLNNDEYKKLIDCRATCLNVFKQNIDYVMKAEKGFNFSNYYNSTPFSDNSVMITANTIRYTTKSILNTIL